MNHCDQIKSRTRLTGKHFAEIERMYLLEGLARRISCQPDAAKVVIRGSLATSIWLRPFPREIMDLDLMTELEDPGGWGMDFLMRVLQHPIPEDGIEIDVAGTTWEETFVYTSPGLRATIPCKICSQWIQIQIDLAGKDTLSLSTEWMGFPSLDPEMGFQIHTVVPEQAAAWKMHGPFEFWDTSGTWRVKDIFDVVMMFRNVEMDPEKLSIALAQAFLDKKTPPHVCERFISGEFGKSRGSRRAWKNFAGTTDCLKHVDSLESLLAEANAHFNSYYIRMIAEDTGLVGPNGEIKPGGANGGGRS